jgi:uncharacterized membrane protein
MTAPEPHAHNLEDRDYFTVMAHFYRGEVGRIMLWRQRLDVTTNWAIVTATAIITYALSHVDASHMVFVFANLICLFLLFVESRRYRYYDAFRARVRMIEAHFLQPAVLHRAPDNGQRWREQLAEDLSLPSFKISRREALFRRYGRNYVWIFLIIGGAWLVKVWSHYPESRSLAGFLPAIQHNQPLPPGCFWSLGVVFVLLQLYLVAGALRLKPYTPGTDIGQVHERRWQV